ncbi:MAG: chromosomal replication initiator DnaA [Paracoccaceae bacterium]
MTGVQRSGTTVTRQLAFDLPNVATFRRDDFFTSPANDAALRTVDDPTTTRLLLVGPPGSGKTHMAHIWATAHGAQLIPLSDLSEALPGIASTAAIAIDAADHPARNETALFHLHNLLAPSGRLLLTATTPPRDWAIQLPDLLSRLQAMPMARLDPPDDALLSAVLIKLFADRQITVPPNLIAYLVARMERSIDAARRLVALLDARALALARPISRTLAAEVLDG